MVDTTVDIGGLKLSAPFLIASGPYQGTGEQIKHWVKEMAANHWAGLVTKSYGRTRFERFSIDERPYLWTTDTLRRVGMQNRGPNIGTMSKDSMRELAESVKVAHEHGLIIIGSISRLLTLRDWQEAAELMTGSGVDAIELNMGCPAYRASVIQEMAEDTGEESPVVGYLAGKDVETAAKVTSTVRKSTNLPIFVKLPPLDVADVVEACKKEGATGATLVNTVGGFLGVDVETTVPVSSAIYGRGFVSGLSGPMIKPIGLSVVAEVSSLVDIPIFGVGGISKWQDAVEYIMVGASAVQICTAFMWRGFRLGRTMYQGLTDFMERKGYKSIADFKGVSLKYLEMPHQDVKVVARIDPEECNQCELCYVACNEGSYGAITKKDGLLAVDVNKCVGCGLCKVVCPVGAITLRRVA